MRGSLLDEDQGLCRVLPDQCDLYSLPLDNVSNSFSPPRPVVKPSVVSSSTPVRRQGGRSNENSIATSRPENVMGRTSSARDRNRRRAGGISSSNIQSTNDPSSRMGQEAAEDAQVSVRLRLEPEQLVGSSFQVSVSSSSSQPLDIRHHNDSGNEESYKSDFEVTSSSASNLTFAKQSRRSRSVDAKISSIGLGCINGNGSIDESESDFDPHAFPSKDMKHEKKPLGQSILNLFKRKSRTKAESDGPCSSQSHGSDFNIFGQSRALPTPPPQSSTSNSEDELNEAEPQQPCVRISCGAEGPVAKEVSWSDEDTSDGPVEATDFTVSIERVKDCGWYWGPLSSEAAEDLLRGEPDGSFIVRDSSDVHYIFSLTFKLNGLVRHVRIEHDQGNFSFGPLTRFKASTIVDFVEKAVAHSRSGRYLFFLHRRPVLGPMRVQLLHPYSRFRHPRSLQHMCRFVILKYVRRDLISSLPLPKTLHDYLNTPHYYFENTAALLGTQNDK